MPEERTEELSPLAALQGAFFDGVVRILRPRPLLRLLLGIAGGTVFAVGLLLAPFWSVPLVAWLETGQVAGVALIGGSYALGLWHLSRTRAARMRGDQQPGADLVAQLKGLHKLHTMRVLTDEEFRQAKARLLE